MKKTFFVAIASVALLISCNSKQPAAQEETQPAPPPQTEVKVEVEQPKPATEVQVGPNGVKVNVQDKSGTSIEIESGKPK